MNVRALLLLCLSVASLAASAPAAAEQGPGAPALEYEPPACGSAEVNSLAAVDCFPATDEDGDVAEPAATLDEAFSRSFVVPDDAWLPANCRLPAKVVLYTSSDWLRLGQKMVADSSRCAEFFVSIPALAANKIGLRVLQDDLLRALGPRIHPMAEIHVGGWQAWVAAAPGRTWYDAGVEARRVMAAAGYGSEPGESWAINEFSSAVRRGLGVARENMRAFVRGLYEGAPGMEPLPGVVFVIGLGQTTEDTGSYRETLKEWLADEPFWSDMDRYVRFWAQETYADARNWGVDAPRNTRAEEARTAGECCVAVGLRLRVDDDQRRADAELRLLPGVRHPPLRRKPPAPRAGGAHRLRIRATAASHVPPPSAQ
jgi:hypothetical protein